MEELLITKIIDRPLSSLYFHLSIAPTDKLERTFGKWQVDLPGLMEEEWEDCLYSFVTNMILPVILSSKLNSYIGPFIPKRLTAVNLAVPVSCPRCGAQVASYKSNP